MEKSLEIVKDKILLVEGNDDRTTIYTIIKSLGIDNIQVLCIEGKHNADKFIDTLSAALKTSQSRTGPIQAFGIILDADELEAKSSFQRVCSFLREIQKRKIKNLNFDIPSKCAEFTSNNTKVGVYIMPDCKSPGMLETLCLESVSSEPFFSCVNDFINQALSIKNDLDHLEKRRALSYIALKAKKGQRKTIGQAVEDNIFNVDSSAFDNIKKFITDMSNL